MLAAKDLALPAFGRFQPGLIAQPALPTPSATPVAPPIISSGFVAIDRELPGGGWPRGELIELLTNTASGTEVALCLPALTQLQDRNCLWVLPCQDSVPSALAADPSFADQLAASGLTRSRQFVVRPLAPRECWWTLEQALRSRQFGAVMAWLPAGSAAGDFRALRRLHGLARLGDTLSIVVRDAHAANAPSPASARLQIDPANTAGQLHASLLRRRGRVLCSPLDLQLDSSARSHPAHSLPSSLPISLPA